MKRVSAILTVVLAGATSVTLMAQSVNGIKAVVHDSVITFQEVQEATQPYIDTLQRQYRDDPDLLQKKYAEAANDSLEKQIERQMVLHDYAASEYQLPKSIIEGEVDDEIQDRIHARYGDRAKLTKTLQAEGLTYEKFRKELRDNFIERVMRARNVSSEIMISPHKIELYYQAHPEQFQVEDQVKLRMIVLNKQADGDAAQTRELADEICAKINEGATFAEMAKVYSQGSQRSEGGDWGWVERSVLRKELAETAFALPVGSMSDVIETPEADYLMFVEEKKPAHVKPLSDVRDEIDKTMQSAEQERLQRLYLNKLRQKTFVRYF